MLGKRIYSRIIIYALLSPIILYISWLIADRFDKVDTALGNILSVYFYYINTDPKPDQNEQIQYHQHQIKRAKDPELKYFLQSLDWTQRTNLNYYDTHYATAWNQVHGDGSSKTNYLKFWQTVRPQVRQVYDEYLWTDNIEYPVAHFRCSDPPFNKHPQYHLPMASSVNWMASLVQQRGFKNLVLLSCNSHNSYDQNKSCRKYADFYAQIFENHGISVSIQCNSIVGDFQMMVYSPLLLSLNASSYSFMAGIAKDPHDYISNTMGLELDDKYFLQTDADWILDRSEPLLHSKVSNYHDTSTVIEQLK